MMHRVRALDSQLPIYSLLPQLDAALRRHTSCVLQAAPGAGKTTQVPLALLDADWLNRRKILMLEPRRLAARAAAQRMAQSLGEPVGRSVGYRIRFEQKVSAHTRIEVLTEGILTRRLQTDSELRDVGLLIFDEFHERHLHSDLALALALDIQQGLRPDLKILIMSATLDVAPLTDLLQAPLLQSEGRSFPVAISYLTQEPKGDIALIAAQAAAAASTTDAGDVLVFMPGAREIRSAVHWLSERAAPDVRVLPLYGDLSATAQDAALRSEPNTRRIIVATPIAETSLTIPGVRSVIDTGLLRRPRLDANSGLTHLETVRVSQASATQRAGRAGRTAPGTCLRLWTETMQRGLVPHLAPEIATTDLAPLMLELAVWGAAPESLRWLDAPPPAHRLQARELLRELGALDIDFRITAQGRVMAALPMHPRLARMLLAAQKTGRLALAADIAALISERDLLRGADARDADLRQRLQILRAYRRDVHSLGNIDRNACAQIERVAQQYRSAMGGAVGAVDDGEPGALLAYAYPDRIALPRAANSRRYLLRNGRGAQLREHDPLVGASALVVAHLDGAGGSEATIHLAAAVTPDQLRQQFSGDIAMLDVVRWDDANEVVVAQREEQLGALILSRKPLTTPVGTRVVDAMLEGIARLGLAALPWNDATRQWQARVLCLREWFPEEAWPDVSDSALARDWSWLTPYLSGITRRAQLAQLDLEAILRARLDWRQQARMDAAAPTHLTVPSGSRVRLHYEVGQPPVLAVKLQELFGLADTPRVADGRIAVLLHLLSPAKRPIQVTQDLRGFWERTYAEVKKELKGRYPKHPWPDDPWRASPTARTQRRS